MALYDDTDWLTEPTQSRERRQRLAKNGEPEGGMQATSEESSGRRSHEREGWTRNTIQGFWRAVIATWLFAAALIVVLLFSPMPDKPAVNHAPKPPEASTPLPNMARPLATDDETNPCSDPDQAHFRC